MIGVWIVICVLSEKLEVPSYSGDASVTMASTAGLAAIMLFGRGPGMIIGAVSTAIAYAFILRNGLSPVIGRPPVIWHGRWRKQTARRPAPTL